MGRGVIISTQKKNEAKIPKIIYQQGWQDVVSYNNNGYSAGNNLQRSCSCTSYTTPASGSGFNFVVDCTNINYISMAIYIGGSGSTDSYGTVQFTGTIGGVSRSFSNYVPSTDYGGSSTTLRWDVSNLKGKQTFTSSWRATCRGPGDWVWSTNQTISISNILCGK